MPTSQTPDTSQIESKFREALSGQSALSGYSLPELNLFLKMLDPMMIRDIDRAMESYQAKKEPILEVCLIFEYLKFPNAFKYNVYSLRSD